MISEKKFYLTKKGLDKVKKEHDLLKNLKYAKTTGEFPSVLHSEDLNPEYLAFQEDIGFLDSKIIELENVIKNVELIKLPQKNKREIVDLGATVKLEETGGKLNEFMVVGTLEANPGQGKISSESPVGKALLGRKIGDEVLIDSPIKTIYKIKQIKYQLS